MSLAAKVGNVESDNGRLRLLLEEKDKEIALLREKIDQLTLAAGLPNLTEMQASMPRMPYKLLRLLMEREFVGREAIENYLYNGEARSPNCTTVHITRLRKLLPRGVTIKNNHGSGYYIPKNEKVLLRL